MLGNCGVFNCSPHGPLQSFRRDMMPPLFDRPRIDRPSVRGEDVLPFPGSRPRWVLSIQSVREVNLAEAVVEVFLMHYARLFQMQTERLDQRFGGDWCAGLFP